MLHMWHNDFSGTNLAVRVNAEGGDEHVAGGSNAICEHAIAR